AARAVPAPSAAKAIAPRAARAATAHVPRRVWGSRIRATLSGAYSPEQRDVLSNVRADLDVTLFRARPPTAGPPPAAASRHAIASWEFVPSKPSSEGPPRARGDSLPT